MKSSEPIHESINLDSRLSNLLLTTLQYVPQLSGLVALGLLVIYALSQSGVLGKPAWQLLAVAGVLAFVSIDQLFVMRLARQGRGLIAYFAHAFAMALAAIALVLFWQGALLAAIVLAWTAPLIALAAGAQGRNFTLSLLLSGATTAAIFWLDTSPKTSRLLVDNAAGLAAVILLTSIVVLFVLTTIAARAIRYRTLRSRLIASSGLIITLPILFVTAISAINGYTSSENQFRDSLQAVASLKQGQLDSIAQRILVEMSDIQQGSGPAASILHVLDRQSETEADYRINASLAATLIRDFMVQHPSSNYEEVLILDTHGSVVLASYTLDEGTSFANEPFFTDGSSKYFAQLIKFPGKQNPTGEYKFVAAAPFYASFGQDIRGVVVVVSKSDLMFNIMGTTPGLSSVDTYLVDVGLAPVSKMQATSSPLLVREAAIKNIVVNRGGEGSGIYANYAGLPVLGYYVWDPTLHVAVVAEVPNGQVISNASTTLLMSGLVGIFAILIAGIALLSTSRAISEPVQALSRVADKFASGELSTRALTDREDEIGNLAGSFNTMADQLQGIIGKLEQRVKERTHDLEQQTLRLRTAAEVARDAASASHPDELLERAASLIRDRFELYHTGIFLLDEKKEYAVLRASPTEAGQKMLATNHRLRVGEQGIVGRSAATGEPRIALDTGADPVYFSNPYLPDTHSEMALPLKSAEGIIGVLDIQSDKPEAFTQDDIAIMQVMADQLATAIERSRLLQRVETNLQQLEQTYQAFTEQSWKVFERVGRQNVGYKYDNVRLEPINNIPPEVQSVLNSGQILNTRMPKSGAAPGEAFAIPIRLRGETIGVINIRLQDTGAAGRIGTMVEQVADRLAIALENARLLEDSLRRANKERTIGEITAKISASVNMRNVLQTAVEELGRALPGSDVLIQFNSAEKLRDRETQS